jgi:PhzF family phenazine biosynthesis protein
MTPTPTGPTKETPIYQVDAFAEEAFRGNPAGVCWLDAPRPEAWMQAVAAEMNVAETSFVSRAADGFDLRWFTPTTEVPLCGHATLASAHILWETGILGPEETARFHTKSGVLRARLRGGRVEIDLPAIPTEPVRAPEPVVRALGVTPAETFRTPDRGLGDHDILVVLESADAVRAVSPDFGVLRREVPGSVIVTARAGASDAGRDIVSRFFAAAWGIDEDPVTGVAHCSLVPFWTRRLGKSEIVGYQASKRGGLVHGRLEGDRVFLSGGAITVLRGAILA